MAGQPAICPVCHLLFPDNNNKSLRGSSFPLCKGKACFQEAHHGSTEAVEAEARTARSRFWTGCSNGRMSGGRLLPVKSPPLGALPTLCTYTGTHTHHTPVICFTLTLSCHERPQKQAEPNGNHHTNLFTTGEHGLLTTGGNTRGSHRGGAL